MTISEIIILICSALGSIISLVIFCLLRKDIKEERKHFWAGMKKIISEFKKGNIGEVYLETTTSKNSSTNKFAIRSERLEQEKEQLEEREKLLKEIENWEEREKLLKEISHRYQILYHKQREIFLETIIDWMRSSEAERKIYNDFTETTRKTYQEIKEDSLKAVCSNCKLKIEEMWSGKKTSENK